MHAAVSVRVDVHDVGYIVPGPGRLAIQSSADDSLAIISLDETLGRVARLDVRIPFTGVIDWMQFCGDPLNPYLLVKQKKWVFLFCRHNSADVWTSMSTIELPGVHGSCACVSSRHESEWIVHLRYDTLCLLIIVGRVPSVSREWIPGETVRSATHVTTVEPRDKALAARMKASPSCVSFRLSATRACVMFSALFKKQGAVECNFAEIHSFGSELLQW